jgi:hypothetical protein
MSITRQLLATIIASTAAVLANVAFYFILQNLFGVEFVAPKQFPPPEVSPLPVTDVILFSAIFSVGASFVFLVVANTARKPAQVFATISVLVLIASFLLPLRIPTPPVPLATKLALVGMHVVGAVVIVPLLISLGLPKKGQVSH